MRKALTAVVPCFNAGPRLRPVAERLCALLDRVIVVDDGSTDGCVAVLAGLPLRIITFDRNRGKGFALLAGISAALEYPETEAVCLLDADGQHRPDDARLLYLAWCDAQADLVIGARVFDRANVPWRSRFGNRVSASVMCLLLGPGVTDTQCGFRILSRAFAHAVVDALPGGRYETEMAVLVKAVREGRRLVCAPIATVYEAGNASSHFRKVRDSFRVIRTLVLHGFRLRK